MLLWDVGVRVDTLAVRSAFGISDTFGTRHFVARAGLTLVVFTAVTVYTAIAGATVVETFRADGVRWVGIVNPLVPLTLHKTFIRADRTLRAEDSPTTAWRWVEWEVVHWRSADTELIDEPSVEVDRIQEVGTSGAVDEVGGNRMLILCMVHDWTRCIWATRELSIVLREDDVVLVVLKVVVQGDDVVLPNVQLEEPIA